MNYMDHFLTSFWKLFFLEFDFYCEQSHTTFHAFLQIMCVGFFPDYV